MDREELIEGDDPRIPLYNWLADVCLRPTRFNVGGTVIDLPFFGYDCYVLDDGRVIFSEYQTTTVGSLRPADGGRFVATAVPPRTEGATWRDEATQVTQKFDAPAEAMDWFLSVSSPHDWIPHRERPSGWQTGFAKVDAVLRVTFDASARWERGNED